jgi:hypothetical protein
MDYPEFIVRVVSPIPDKGQVSVRYYGLRAKIHRGKVGKASVSHFFLRIFEQGKKSIPSKDMSRILLGLDSDHRQRIQFFHANQYAHEVQGGSDFIQSQKAKSYRVPYIKGGNNEKTTRRHRSLNHRALFFYWL